MKKTIYATEREINLILFCRSIGYGTVDLEVKDGEPYKVRSAIKSSMLDQLKSDTLDQEVLRKYTRENGR